MASQHEISEYIENLPLQKALCKGYRPDDVYEVICNLSSMYNQLLSEALMENDELKHQIEYLGNRPEELKQKDGLLLNDEVNETAITDKEFRKMKDVDLLEILLEKSKENGALKIQLENKEREIEELNKKILNRKIEIERAGNLAEASFKINGVLKSTEMAAQQYLDNLQDLYDKENRLYSKKQEEIENRCTTLLQATQARCDYMKEEVMSKCEEMEACVRKQCEEMLKTAELKCKEKERETQERCFVLDQKAKTDVDKRWDDLSKRLEDFYTAHEGLRELLVTSKII